MKKVILKQEVRMVEVMGDGYDYDEDDIILFEEGNIYEVVIEHETSRTFSGKAVVIINEEFEVVSVCKSLVEEVSE